MTHIVQTYVNVLVYALVTSTKSIHLIYVIFSMLPRRFSTSKIYLLAIHKILQSHFVK